MTTDELIETLERLEKEATPRPWVSEWDADDDVEGPYMVGGCIKAGGVDLFEASDGCRAKDLDAVAEIRNHLPALISALKENKRLREALEAIPELIADQADHDVLAVVWTALQPQGLVAALLNTPVRNAAKKKRGTQVIKPQGDAKP